MLLSSCPEKDIRIEVLKALLNDAFVSEDARKGFVSLVEDMCDDATPTDDNAWAAYLESIGIVIDD